MKIYQLAFNYAYALADIKESLNGADSLELCSENPEIIKSFKYDWITNESEIIPDFVFIMSNLLGCKSNISSDIMEMIPSLNLNPVKIANDDYALFSNTPILSDCLNLKKSKVVRFSNGDIMEVPLPVFLPGDYPILFKVENIPSSYFCTQELKNLLDTQSYTGLLFNECGIKSKSWF